MIDLTSFGLPKGHDGLAHDRYGLRAQRVTAGPDQGGARGVDLHPPDNLTDPIPQRQR